MTDQRVLLVGGAGYIGSHCALELSRAGYQTTIYDDLSSGHREAVVGELVEGDVRDGAHLEQVLIDGAFHAVMHFAARLDVGESVREPELYYHLNVGGSLTLLHAMRRARVPALVFSSTCAVYGNPQFLPLREDHPREPVSPYGRSKNLVETVMEELRADGRLRCTALRYFNAAGADPGGALGEAHDPELHLVPLTLEAATGRRTLEVYGMDWDTRDGTCIRDYVHVSDLAVAHRLALEALLGGEAGSAYNLGTGTGTTVMEVIEAVERVTGARVDWRAAPRRPGDAEGLFATSDRAHRALGWTPHHRHVDDIVRTAWNWYQNPRFPPAGDSR